MYNKELSVVKQDGVYLKILQSHWVPMGTQSIFRCEYNDVTLLARYAS